MTQCMSLYASDQGLPNRDGGIPPHWREMGNFVIYMIVKTWEVILTIRTFLKVKNSILWILHVD